MKQLISRLYRVLLKGLLVVLPVLITAYILIWLATTLESIFGGVIKLLLPDGLEKYYYPGMGFAFALVGLGVVGFLFQMWLFRKLWSLVERGLYNIPLVKSIYGAVKDFTDFMDRSASDDAQKVVMFQIPNTDMRLIGLETRDSFEGLPEGIGGKDTVAVYLPMSYQIGGFTIMLPREQVEPVDLTIEQAMRFALTAGMTLKQKRPGAVQSNQAESQDAEARPQDQQQD